MNPNQKFSRRHVLSGLGGATLGLLAGCQSFSDSITNDSEESAPKMTESWIRVDKTDETDTVIGALLLEEAPSTGEINRRAESVDELAVSDDASFFIVPGWSKIGGEANQPFANIQYRYLSELVDESRIIHFSYDINIHTRELTTDVTAYAFGEPPIPEIVPVSDDARHHIRFADSQEYVLPYDRVTASLTDADSVRFPFDPGPTDDRYHDIPDPNEPDHFQWEGEEKEYPVETGFLPGGTPPIVHLSKRETGGTRFYADLKWALINDMLEWLNPSKLAGRFDRTTDYAVASTMVLIAGGANPAAPAKFPISRVALNAVKWTATKERITSTTDKLSERIDTDYGGVTELIYQEMWLTEMAPYSLADDFAGVDVTGVSPDWPTMFDLRSLSILETNYYSRIALLGQTPETEREEYMNLLSQQEEITKTLIERLNELGPGEEDKSNRTTPVEKNRFIRTTARLVEAELETLLEIIRVQQEQLAPISSIPKVTRKDVIQGTSLSEMVIPTKTGTPESIGSYQSIQGEKFSIRPGERLEIECIYRDSGTEAYQIEDFKIHIDTDDIDEEYALTSITSDSLFNPGDSYALNKNTLNLDSNLRGGGRFTLLMRTSDGWTEITASNISSLEPPTMTPDRPS